MRKLLKVFLVYLFFIISFSTFISAALCKGQDGYYDDCFKLQYGYYPNYYNYPDYNHRYEQRINYDYPYYQEHRYNYDSYPKKKIVYKYDNTQKKERSYNPYLPFRVYNTNDYRTNRYYVGPYIRDEYGNYHLSYY